MLATIGLLGFNALGVHFACVVDLEDVEPSLGSMHGLLALKNLMGQLKKGAVERPIWCCWWISFPGGLLGFLQLERMLLEGSLHGREMLQLLWKLDGPAVHFQVVAAVEGPTHDMIAHLLSYLMDYFEGLLGSACEPLNGLLCSW